MQTGKELSKSARNAYFHHFVQYMIDVNFKMINAIPINSTAATCMQNNTTLTAMTSIVYRSQTCCQGYYQSHNQKREIRIA